MLGPGIHPVFLNRVRESPVEKMAKVSGNLERWES